MSTTTATTQAHDERPAWAREWVDAFIEGWRSPRGADGLVSNFAPLLSPDIRLIQPQLPIAVGYEAFAEQFARPLFELIPDAHAEVERWGAGVDTLYIELTVSGHVAGRRPIAFRACDRITLRDGLAVERESYLDPGPLIATIARTPRAWPAFLRAVAQAPRPHPKKECNEMKEVRLTSGTIRYREAGNGEPIVLVHGLLTDGELWREVIPLLANDFRVIAPDWPLGSHELPLEPTADLSPTGLATVIADFIDALELENVTLVGNDTGGALCQLVAVEHPQRLARLVLTPCDAFEHFPPDLFKPLQLLAHVPGALYPIVQSMRLARSRRLPIAYGWVTKCADDALTYSWVRPALSSRAIRAQTAKIIAGFSPRYTQAAAERFGSFTKPVLVAWAPEDRMFKLSEGERLARAFPNARFERIEDSYTFVAIDQPRRTAELIGAFAREPLAAGTVSA